MAIKSNSDYDNKFISLVLDTLNKKGVDYGSNNDKSPYAIQLAAAKILTKAERIANIIFNSHKPNYESLEDSILDLCGYTILANRAIKRESSVSSKRIYLDVDGVIADLDQWVIDKTNKDYNWENIFKFLDDNYEEAYLKSPLTSNAKYYLDMYFSSSNVMFLTSVGSHWSDKKRKAQAVQNKKIWLTNLGINEQDIIIVDSAEAKIKYADKDSILYDDRQKTIELWNDAGGIGFHVINKHRPGE